MVLLILSQVKNCKHKPPVEFIQGLKLILRQKFLFNHSNMVRDSVFEIVNAIEAVVSIMFFKFFLDDLVSLLSSKVFQVMEFLDVAHLALVLLLVLAKMFTELTLLNSCLILLVCIFREPAVLGRDRESTGPGVGGIAIFIGFIEQCIIVRESLAKLNPFLLDLFLSDFLLLFISFLGNLVFWVHGFWWQFLNYNLSFYCMLGQI